MSNVLKHKDNELVHQKIRGAVKAYKEVFPDDYKGTCEVVMKNRNNLKTKTGAVNTTMLNKQSEILDRALYEISEVLYAILFRQLDQIEFAWLTSKEGGRWFAKNFKEFSLGQD